MPLPQPPRTPSEEFAWVQQDSATWHKLLSIEREGDKIAITVVRGLWNGPTTEILGTKMRVTWTQPLDDFLRSPAIQAKILAPTKRGIILVDVAGYSRFDTRSQAAILTSLNEGLKLSKLGSDLYSAKLGTNIDQIIPTGDGCYLIYHERASTKMLLAAINVHSSYRTHQRRSFKIHDRNDDGLLGIRLAAHVGEVDFITDAAGNRNAFGTGLNDAARILHAGREAYRKQHENADPVSVVYFSDTLDGQRSTIPSYLLQPGSTVHVDLGEAKAKHDQVFKLRCLTSLPSSVAFALDPLPELPPNRNK